MLKYNGSAFSIELGPRAERSIFLEPLSKFNGEKPWALTLVPLHGRDYDEMLASGAEATEFLQAGGSADCMTIQIRRPGGKEWGVVSIWGVVARPSSYEQPRDIPVKLPNSTQMITRSEVFKAEEAADLFFAYYSTGDIPASYVVRPITGWTAKGQRIDLESHENRAEF